MTDADIEAALGQHLLAMPGVLAVVWENKATDLPLPYLTVGLVPVSRTDRTLAGGSEIARGFLFVTVISELDAFATAARDVCSAISARFPYGLRLAGSGGTVTITKPVETQAGFRDGATWRTSARVDYEAS